MSVYIREFIRACEAFGWQGGPEYRTEITEMENKGEKRNAKWSQSRFFASLPFMNIREEMYGNILDMFDDRMGQWGNFLYRNQLKHTAADELFATALPGQTTFQLGIYVGRPGRMRKRNICALYVPDEDSDGEALQSEIEITVDGVPSSAFLIDYDRGLVEADTPMAGGEVLRWSGQYAHWVRFNQDRLPFSIDSRSEEGFAVNGSIELIGVNPPKLPNSSASS